jgi:hypothetical protein
MARRAVYVLFYYTGTLPQQPSAVSRMKSAVRNRRRFLLETLTRSLKVELHVAARANAFLQAANFSAQRSFDALGSTLSSSYAADVRRIDSEVAGYAAVEAAIEADSV